MVNTKGFEEMLRFSSLHRLKRVMAYVSVLSIMQGTPRSINVEV